MPNIIGITPFMHVPDLEAALHFFVDVLGFTLELKAPGYAYIQREAAAFRLLEDPTYDAAYKRRFAYYIDVEDLAALHDELRPMLETLPDREHHGPTDQPYGQRELRIMAPDGNLLAFEQALHPMPNAIRRPHELP